MKSGTHLYQRLKKFLPGLSDTEISRRIGVGQSTVSAWKCDAKYPTRGTLDQICERLGVDLAALEPAGSDTWRITGEALQDCLAVLSATQAIAVGDESRAKVWADCVRALSRTLYEDIPNK